MKIQLSAGKWLGMTRMGDAEGKYKILAIDQRPPIENQIKLILGNNNPSWEDVSRVKKVIAESLASESSALLMDPIYAWPVAYKALSDNQGLLLTLEHAKFEETSKGRLSDNIPNWNTSKIKRVGADGLKLLVWYRPDVSSNILKHQQDYVKRTGEQCVKHDIPFVLELLVYPLPGENPDIFKQKKTSLVLESVREFSKFDYAVDLFKLENPCDDAISQNSDNSINEKIQKIFDELGQLVGRPWVMLSAGTKGKNFKQILGYAYRAGASGYLAGRSIWWEAFINNFPDSAKIKKELLKGGVDYMREINSLTEKFAKPWYSHSLYGETLVMEHANAEFSENYSSIK